MIISILLHSIYFFIYILAYKIIELIIVIHELPDENNVLLICIRLLRHLVLYPLIFASPPTCIKFDGVKRNHQAFGTHLRARLSSRFSMKVYLHSNPGSIKFLEIFFVLYGYKNGAQNQWKISILGEAKLIESSHGKISPYVYVSGK